LIAITYGLARYAFGLFVPAIRDDLALSPEVIGVIGAMPFVSFVLASVAAPFIAARLGARAAACTAGAFALAGLAGIGVSVSPITLGASVFACGIATGLMMPALSTAVEAGVARAQQGRVNAIMNAGTSLGLVACAPAVLAALGAWRSAYAAFAATALVGIAAAWWYLPGASRFAHGVAGPPRALGALAGLAGFGFLLGFVGSAYWIFAPDLLTELGAVSPRMTAGAWLIVGVAGLAGAWASDLAYTVGYRGAHALMLATLAAAFALLAAAPDRIGIAAASAAVFGWAFMSATGLFLVCGVHLLPGRAEWGPVVPFLAIAVGQAVGSPSVGALIGAVGYADAFAASAVVALAVAAASPAFPMAGPHPTAVGPQPASAPP